MSHIFISRSRFDLHNEYFPPRIPRLFDGNRTAEALALVDRKPRSSFRYLHRVLRKSSRECALRWEALKYTNLPSGYTYVSQQFCCH